MSTQERRKAGQIDCWEVFKRKYPNGCENYDIAFPGGFMIYAPMGSVIQAGEEPNSYMGWLISNPNRILYVAGDDAEFRVIAALWTALEVDNSTRTRRTYLG